MALSDLTPEAVNKAINEFDHLKRDAFLEKYGFGQARTYMLQVNNRSYDLKLSWAQRTGIYRDNCP